MSSRNSCHVRLVSAICNSTCKTGPTRGQWLVRDAIHEMAFEPQRIIESIRGDGVSFCVSEACTVNAQEKDNIKLATETKYVDDRSEKHILAQCEQLEASRQFESAVSLLTASLASDGTAVRLLLKRAALYQTLERFDDAATDLDAAVDAAPTNVTVRVRRGNFRASHGGDPGGAFDDFSVARSLSPINPAPIESLALLYLKAQIFETALSLAREAAAIAPQSSVAHGIVGLCHFSVKEFREAEAAHRRAIELNPREPENWVQLGRTLRELGDDAGATTAMLMAFDLGGGARPLVSLASTAIDRHDTQLAKAYLSRAKDAEPSRQDRERIDALEKHIAIISPE